jgi:hypothetical protein
MNGLINHITGRPWPDIVTVWYVLVDDATSVSSSGGVTDSGQMNPIPPSQTAK